MLRNRLAGEAAAVLITTPSMPSLWRWGQGTPIAEVAAMTVRSLPEEGRGSPLLFACGRE